MHGGRNGAFWCKLSKQEQERYESAEELRVDAPQHAQHVQLCVQVHIEQFDGKL